MSRIKESIRKILAGAKSDSVRRVLREMAAEGAVVKGQNRRYRLAGERPDPP